MKTTKTYMIVGFDGSPKASWGEIRCDSADVLPTGLVCFYVDDELTTAYKLAEGEALIYCHAEEDE
jgi:hypothetical protein